MESAALSSFGIASRTVGLFDMNFVSLKPPLARSDIRSFATRMAISSFFSALNMSST